MNLYNVIYGVGDACGGFNRAMVVASMKEHIKGMLNEQEGDEVLLTSIQLVSENISEHKSEQVLSVEIA